MNLLEQFVTDQMQFVNKLGQFVKIARAVVGRVCVLLREFEISIADDRAQNIS